MKILIDDADAIAIWKYAPGIEEVAKFGSLSKFTKIFLGRGKEFKKFEYEGERIKVLVRMRNKTKVQVDFVGHISPLGLELMEDFMTAVTEKGDIDA